MTNKNVIVRIGKTKHNQSIVERFNGILEGKIFRPQEGADLLLPIHEH